jgi:predicted O-methyltransferase YrrM
MAGLDSGLASRLNGFYARSVYLPVSSLAQALRRKSRRIRGVERGQKTNLPVARWQDLLPAKAIAIVAPRKNSGDVSLAELAVLATAAAATSVGNEIIEIGTFEGRTALNFAANAPLQLRIVTLDLPPDLEPKFALAPVERSYVDKPLSGRLFRDAASRWQAAAARIEQVLGDSATFDWSPHFGRAGLVFVDGSHAYDYVLADSAVALRLVANKGMVIWHDYGVWEGVTRALEQLEASRHLGLRHVRGTSLAIWRAGELGDRPAP